MLSTKFRFICPSVSEKTIFKYRTLRNKNCLWRPCLLTDLNKISKRYRGHSEDASYPVSIYLAKRFKRRLFFLRNQPIRKKYLSMQAMFVNGSRQMSKLQREPSIDASYQVSLHMTEGFQRRRLKCEKLTDDGRQVIKWWQRLTLPLARWANYFKLPYNFAQNSISVCFLTTFVMFQFGWMHKCTFTVNLYFKI
jgi:hypothetical protein